MAATEVGQFVLHEKTESETKGNLELWISKLTICEWSWFFSVHFSISLEKMRTIQFPAGENFVGDSLRGGLFDIIMIISIGSKWFISRVGQSPQVGLIYVCTYGGNIHRTSPITIPKLGLIPKYVGDFLYTYSTNYCLNWCTKFVSLRLGYVWGWCWEIVLLPTMVDPHLRNVCDRLFPAKS